MQSGIIYVMVSGGMESVYMLWKLMKESPYEIKAHHIKLHTFQGRQEVEWIAINNSINWLKKNIKPVDLSVTEYKQDFKVYIEDTSIISYVAACFTKLDNVVAIAQGQTPLYDPPSEYFLRRERKLKAIYKATSWDNSIPQIFPIYGKTREEIFKEMPRELFNLTWSCREPIKTKTHWESCGKCGQICIPFKERGIPLNKIKLGGWGDISSILIV